MIVYKDDKESPGGFKKVVEGEITYDELMQKAQEENLLDSVKLFHGANGPSYSVLVDRTTDNRWLVRQVYDMGPVGGYIADTEGNAYMCALDFLREMNEQITKTPGDKTK